jgi:hypothetical protein
MSSFLFVYFQVLDDGHIVEFDHPFTLLNCEDSYFSKMVLQTGASEAEHLLSIAKDSYTSSDKDVADHIVIVKFVVSDKKKNMLFIFL